MIDFPSGRAMVTDPYGLGEGNAVTVDVGTEPFEVHLSEGSSEMTLKRSGAPAGDEVQVGDVQVVSGQLTLRDDGREVLTWPTPSDLGLCSIHMSKDESERVVCVRIESFPRWGELLTELPEGERGAAEQYFRAIDNLRRVAKRVTTTAQDQQEKLDDLTDALLRSNEAGEEWVAARARSRP